MNSSTLYKSEVEEASEATAPQLKIDDVRKLLEDGTIVAFTLRYIDESDTAPAFRQVVDVKERDIFQSVFTIWFVDEESNFFHRGIPLTPLHFTPDGYRHFARMGKVALGGLRVTSSEKGRRVWARDFVPTEADSDVLFTRAALAY